MIQRFSKKAGSNVAQSQDDLSMQLVGAVTPAWVRLPPQLGGQRLQVESVHSALCPKCFDYKVVHLHLEQSYGVAECPRCTFVWYRRGHGEHSEHSERSEQED